MLHTTPDTIRLKLHGGTMSQALAQIILCPDAKTCLEKEGGRAELFNIAMKELTQYGEKLIMPKDL